MLFRVLNLSTLIYSKFCECDVLYCALIFHECDVVPPQYEGIWFFCGFWFRSAYSSNTLAFRTLCFLVPPCFQYDPCFLWLFHCSTLMHHVFSNPHEHFLLRSVTFWFFEADAVLCAPSFLLDIFQVLSFWCVFQYFDFWWIRCAAPVRWNMIFMMQLVTRSAHNSNILHFGRLSFFECLFASTKNYSGFFRKWCATGSVCYTLTFLFYLITSFSQQFNVIVFGSCCCFGFSIFLLWFIPSFVNVMCCTVLWFFMNVMLCRPSMKEYDFSVASDFVLLTARTLWLFELYAFWFLLASSMIHVFCDCFTAPLWCTMFFPIPMNTFCSGV